MTKMIFSGAGAQSLAEDIAGASGIPHGRLDLHRFPDGETLFRILDTVENQDIFLVARLDNPDAKLLHVLMLANGFRQQGAKSVTLVSPYLPYMRQDIAFNPGEIVSAAAFAKLISHNFDQLITVDPHLHRYTTLDEIYEIPTYCVSADEPIAGWISSHSRKSMIVGPDIESEQWVRKIAGHLKAPYQTLRKIRRGDRDVEISLPDLTDFNEHTIVLVDDIISSGATMLQTVRRCHVAYPDAKILCCATHCLATIEVLESFASEGVQAVAATETVLGPNSTIAIANQLSKAIIKSAGR
jgi:ribose-phosphate pyrophosphokinase